MPRVGRTALVAAGTAALCAVPAVVGALPAPAGRLPLPQLLAKIRASAGTPYTGLVESRGALGLPTLPRLGDLDALLSGSSRLRVWYAGPQRLRVDRLSPVGEDDTYRDPAGTSTWHSDDRSVTRVEGVASLRLPADVDLLPPELARRLTAPATAAELRLLPARRIAGRDAVGLRIDAPAATTFGRIDVWADPATGLPLRVDVVPRGGSTPVVTTAFADLRLGPPPAALTAFTPPPDAQVDVQAAPDIVAEIDRFAPYQLPARVAGLPERPRVGGLQGGAATYGVGYPLVAVLPLRDDFAFSLLDRLKGVPAVKIPVAGGRALAVRTPLVTVVVAVGPYQSFLLAGTVPVATLQRAVRQLAAAPLPYRNAS